MKEFKTQGTLCYKTKLPYICLRMDCLLVFTAELVLLTGFRVLHEGADFRGLWFSCFFQAT